MYAVPPSGTTPSPAQSWCSWWLSRSRSTATSAGTPTSPSARRGSSASVCGPTSGSPISATWASSGALACPSTPGSAITCTSPRRVAHGTWTFLAQCRRGFLVSGLWHGADWKFVTWVASTRHASCRCFSGAQPAARAGMALEPVAVRAVDVHHGVLGLGLFRANNFDHACDVLSRMASGWTYGDHPSWSSTMKFWDKPLKACPSAGSSVNSRLPLGTRRVLGRRVGSIQERRALDVARGVARDLVGSLMLLLASCLGRVMRRKNSSTSPSDACVDPSPVVHGGLCGPRLHPAPKCHAGFTQREFQAAHDSVSSSLGTATATTCRCAGCLGSTAKPKTWSARGSACAHSPRPRAPKAKWRWWCSPCGP